MEENTLGLEYLNWFRREDSLEGVPSTISLAVHVISFPAFLATQVYSPVSDSWTSRMFNFRSLPSAVNLYLGPSRRFPPSFIHEVMAVDGEIWHSKTAEEPMDSASCNTMSSIFLTNFNGTAFSLNPPKGSSGGEGPFPPGLRPRPLPLSPGEGVCLTATIRMWFGEFYRFIAEFSQKSHFLHIQNYQHKLKTVKAFRILARIPWM